MNNWCICWVSRIFLLGILIFKGLTARRLYKSFGVKGIIICALVLWVVKKRLHWARNVQYFINFLTCGPMCIARGEEKMNEQNILSAVVMGADNMSCRRE
jgi:hypothetical protein